MHRSRLVPLPIFTAGADNSAAGLPAGLSISSAGVISGTPTANGTSTVTVTAKDGNGACATQSFVWTVAPGTAAASPGVTGPVTGYQGLCLDVRSANGADGTPVQVYTCNGTVVQLYTCNGTGAQKWQSQSSGELVNSQSGNCLDDTGYGGSGTQVQIWSCGDTANQQWKLP